MSEGPLSLAFKFVNFAVLVGVLYKFGSKPFKDYILSRHNAVKAKIDEAERQMKEAEALEMTYQERLAHLDEEIDAFRTMSFEEMEREKKRILEEAQNLATRIREQARLAYSQEMKEALARIRAEIANQTIRSAEETMRREFKQEDHNRMVEEFIENVRRMP